ncbi:MAG: 30S ribosomal protein S4 [Patescibacteria group bacterium]|nr:30S ribosomal protein S4 [Patescibacteria group bacterium]
MRDTGPKNRLARQLGVDLGLKTPGTNAHVRLLRRINIPPGQHGNKKIRKISEYGLQLKEKQKIKYIFGINERQLKNYFKKASSAKGNTSLLLCQFLERRLDNVLYRLGFVPTRSSGRQLITHGHVMVNGKKVTIPSYQVKIGDQIAFLDEKKILGIPYLKEFIEKSTNVVVPSWLKRENLRGEIVALPDGQEISKQVNLRLVIEYYSK